MMRMNLDSTDLALLRLQDLEHALALARRLVASHSAHWTEPKCDYLKSPVRPCTCGLVESRRELAKAVPR